jgi:hypothetical protein
LKETDTDEIMPTAILDTADVADYHSVIGYFAQSIMKDLRLVRGYDVLYGKFKAFVQEELFDPVQPAFSAAGRRLRRLFLRRFAGASSAGGAETFAAGVSRKACHHSRALLFSSRVFAMRQR